MKFSKKVVSIIALAIIIFLGSIFLYYTQFSTSQYLPPYFVPNQNETYIISKRDGIYYIPYTRPNGATDIPVGKSASDLAPFIGKEAIIEVEYPKSAGELRNYLRKQQCIQNNCIALNERSEEAITVNIQSIKLSTSETKN